MAEPEQGGLKARVKKGAGWILGGHGIGQVIRFLANVLMAKLLTPEAFGLMALVSAFIEGLSMFTDVGLEPNLIQSKRGEEPGFLRTAWTIKVGRGILLALLCVRIAYPVSQYYQQPQLLFLLPVCGLTPLIEGLASTKGAVLSRKMDYARLVKQGVFSYLFGVAVMVALGLVWPSVWALVFARLAHAASATISSHIYLPGIKHGFQWDKKAVSELSKFGIWIFLSTAFTFVGAQGDRLILGHYLSPAVLGVYSIALRLVQTLTMVQSRLSRSVLMPAFSETLREKSQELARIYKKARLPMDLVFISGAGALFMGGHWVIELLYDDRYQAAGWILRYMAIAVAMAGISEQGLMLLLSHGHSKLAFWRSLTKAVWLIVLMPLGFHHWGLKGIVLAVVSSELPALLVVYAGLMKVQVFRLSSEVRAILCFALGSALGLGADTLLSRFFV